MANLISKAETFEKLRNFATQQKKHVCFIFGAGASSSYTAVNTDYFPPMVAQLFDDHNQTVRNVIHRPQHSHVLSQRVFLLNTLENYANDLERYLSYLYDSSDDDDIFTLLLLYLQDVYSLASRSVSFESNNYKDLINQLFDLLRKSRWTCISFNYDTILEQSYLATGRDRFRNFEKVDGYLKSIPKILKMHGGVNFRYRIKEKTKTRRRTDKDVFNSMMGIEQEVGVLEVIQLNSIMPNFYAQVKEWNPQKGDHELLDIYDFPLMMIPVHGTKKSENSFFKLMLEESKKELANASLVIAIGYNFGDELFANEMRKLDLSQKELILVGSNKLYNNPENHPAYKNASSIFGEERVKVFGGAGITEFVQAIIRKQLP